MKVYTRLLSIAERAILRNASVICCTCVTARDARLTSIDFKNVVDDEMLEKIHKIIKDREPNK